MVTVAKRVARPLVVACILATVVAACGSSSSGSGKSSSNSNAASSAQTAKDVAEARAIVAPYLNTSAFPVDTKLARRPVGEKMVLLSPGTPVAVSTYPTLKAAAKLLGFKLQIIDSGATASTTAAAVATAITEKPAIVSFDSVSLDLWQSQIKALRAAHIQIQAAGDTGAQNYGITDDLVGTPFWKLMGTLQAAYIAGYYGQKSNVAIYWVPALSFMNVSVPTFESELKKLCPGCTVRLVPIDIATLGSTSAQTIASDLQAHPSTTVAWFAADEMAEGLPAALKAVGIKQPGTIKTMGNLPIQLNLQNLKSGVETTSLVFDLPIDSYEMMDMAARQAVGQKLTGEEAQGLVDMRFLNKNDITSTTQLWSGYPNYVQRFEKLWGVS